MKIRICLLCFLALTGIGAIDTLRAKEIALTFEKLPYMEPLGFFTPREVSNLILRALETREIKAVGFVVEERIDQDPSSFIVLRDWIRDGHDLGNNTYSYVDYHELSRKDFLIHVADNQKYTARAVGRRLREVFFRFPLLHQGETQDKKEDAAERLARAGFIVTPATVVVSDFAFNHFFKLVGDAAVQERLKELYLRHIGEALDYAEAQSERVFGRQIKQILRLHMGVATASYMRDVLELLEARGYEFITVREAMADPAFDAEETYAGPLGLGFIDRVAATRGLEFDPEAGEVSMRGLEEALEEAATSPE